MLSNYKTKNSDENNEFLMNYIVDLYKELVQVE